MSNRGILISAVDISIVHFTAWPQTEGFAAAVIADANTRNGFAVVIRAGIMEIPVGLIFNHHTVNIAFANIVDID